MGQTEQKIKELGLTLPETPLPIAAYVPAVSAGGFVYVSGQLPMEGGKVVFTGKVGCDTDVEEAYAAAKLCALRAVAALKSAVGDLDRVTQIVKVTGFVNATPEFKKHAAVVNGASELLGVIFGEKGKHARAAVGVASLPENAAVEVELIAFVG